MKVSGKSAIWRHWACGVAAAASLLCSAPSIAVEKQDTQSLSARQRKAGDVVTVAVSELPAGLSVGPARVQVGLTAAPGIDTLQLSYTVEGSLRVEPTAPTEVRLDAQHHAVVEIPLTVLASGLHYLHVHVKAGAHSSAFAVRVDAGAVQGTYKAMRQSRVLQDAGFVEMPAQETRRY